jgi:hypothetical protein
MIPFSKFRKVLIGTGQGAASRSLDNISALPKVAKHEPRGRFDVENSAIYGDKSAKLTGVPKFM